MIITGVQTLPMIPAIANIRLLVVCLMTLSVALPIAIISLSKLLLLLCALALLLFERRGATPIAGMRMATPIVVLGAMLMLAASLMWSTGPDGQPLTSWHKHGKLVVIALLLFLLRSRREVLWALAAFAVGQTFMLASTWLLVAGLPLPWARANEAASSHAVFSSYLDQSMMTACFAAVCWHLRGLAPGPGGRRLALALLVLSLACVFFVFRARSGHLIAIALVSLAIMWELPQRMRAGALFVPLLVALVFAASSDKVSGRLMAVVHEVQAYAVHEDVTTSSGIRINLWQRSLQALEQRPWAGSGVGSWYQEYNALQTRLSPGSNIEYHSNPHQEFLLWAVELGLPGVVLLGGLMTAMGLDGVRGDRNTSRASLSVVLALVLACLFNCALYDALIGDFFCVLIGLLLALAAHPQPSPALRQMRFA